MRLVGEVFGLDGGDGGRDVAAVLDAVTDDDRIFKEHRVLLEDDVRHGLVLSEGDGGGHITDAGDFEDGRTVHTEGISAVEIRDGTVRGTLDDHARTDDGLSLFIDDLAGHGPHLGRRAEGSRKRGKDDHADGDECFVCLFHFHRSLKGHFASCVRV